MVMAKTSSLEGALDVRFGLKADICSASACPLYPRKRTCAVQLTDVRFVPIADIGWLFDQLVSASEQLAWYLKSKRLCGREIDEEFEIGRLDDRKSAGFSPFRIRPTYRPACRKVSA